MPISMTGLASGIDTQTLIDGLMSVARQPITLLGTRKTQLDAASQTISALSSRLSTLKSTSLALSTPAGFSSLTATSSDTGVVATMTGSSSVASYTVNVTSLAKAQKTRSNSVASATSALGATGSLSLTVGTNAPTTINVAATDSLADVATKIASSGARVSASLMGDGSGYRLIVQGLDTGTDGAFSFGESGVSLGLSTAGNTYETASNAAFTVDGMAITSKSNQVTGVIPGVRLALTKPGATSTISISSDPSALKQKVSAFVSAFNDVVTAGHTASGFGSTKASNPLLSGDSAIRAALHRVGSVVGNAVPGASGSYTTLASVGITARRDGTLAFDSAKLETALSADPSSVTRLFVTDATSGATGMMSTMMTAIDSLLSGPSAPIQARLDSFATRSRRLADSQTKMESRLATYEDTLRKQFSTMDQAVSRYQSMSNALGSITTLNTGSRE